MDACKVKVMLQQLLAILASCKLWKMFVKSFFGFNMLIRKGGKKNSDLKEKWVTVKLGVWWPQS